jgi:hypothetical protein
MDSVTTLEECICTLSARAMTAEGEEAEEAIAELSWAVHEYTRAHEKFVATYPLDST